MYCIARANSWPVKFTGIACFLCFLVSCGTDYSGQTIAQLMSRYPGLYLELEINPTPYKKRMLEFIATILKDRLHGRKLAFTDIQATGDGVKIYFNSDEHKQAAITYFGDKPVVYFKSVTRGIKPGNIILTRKKSQSQQNNITLLLDNSALRRIADDLYNQISAVILFRLARNTTLRGVVERVGATKINIFVPDATRNHNLQKILVNNNYYYLAVANTTTRSAEKQTTLIAGAGGQNWYVNKNILLDLSYLEFARVVRNRTDGSLVLQVDLSKVAAPRMKAITGREKTGFLVIVRRKFEKVGTDASKQVVLSTRFDQATAGRLRFSGFKNAREARELAKSLASGVYLAPVQAVKVVYSAPPAQH